MTKWTDKLDSTQDAHSFLKLVSVMAAELAYVDTATVTRLLKRAAAELAQELERARVECDAE